MLYGGDFIHAIPVGPVEAGSVAVEQGQVEPLDPLFLEDGFAALGKQEAPFPFADQSCLFEEEAQGVQGVEVDLATEARVPLSICSPVVVGDLFAEFEWQIALGGGLEPLFRHSLDQRGKECENGRLIEGGVADRFVEGDDLRGFERVIEQCMHLFRRKAAEVIDGALVSQCYLSLCNPFSRFDRIA